MNKIDFRFRLEFMLYAHFYVKDGLLNFDIEDSTGKTFTTLACGGDDYDNIIKYLNIMSKNTNKISAFINTLKEIKEIAE